MLSTLKDTLVRRFQGKQFLMINLVVFFMLGLYFVLVIRVDEINYFPKKDLLKFEAFSDKEERGDSESSLVVFSDSLLDFKFEIGPADPYPYAGINLDLVSGYELDVSKYNSIAIDFTPTDLDHMSLFLNVEDRNVKNTLHKFKTRRMLSDLFVDKAKGRQTTIVSFDKMQSPNWWYEKLNQSKKEFDEPDWSRLASISISNGINSEPNQFHEFKIHRIYFLRDYTFDILILLSIQLMSVVGTGFYFYVKRLQKNEAEQIQKIEITYKPVQTATPIAVNKTEFLTYIHENFSDAELTLASIAASTGVNSKIISDTIAEEFQCNFKTYINRIRISEAKRLLQKSDLNINEVAFLVGFNSPGHFNRVFKNYTGKTPSEFIISFKSEHYVFC